MPNTVANPPALIAQQTPAWCFAAAELMARTYYGLATPGQYDVARASVMLLVAAQAPPTYTQWNQATLNDLLSNQDENHGANLLSERVQLVRNSYGAINHDATAGQLSNDYTQSNFRADIDSNNIVIIGNAIHYYVVYGYDDRRDFMLQVRDAWPVGVGGQQTAIPYAQFAGWGYRVVINFRR